MARSTSAVAAISLGVLSKVCPRKAIAMEVCIAGVVLRSHSTQPVQLFPQVALGCKGRRHLSEEPENEIAGRAN